MKKALLLGLLFPICGFSQIMTEDFEGTFPPSGWTLQQTNAIETWNHYTLQPIAGTGSAAIDYDDTLGQQDEWLISPSMDLTGMTTAFLSFRASLSYHWSVAPYDNYDFLVKISTNGGTTWTTLWTEEDQGEFETFVPFWKSLDISGYAGNADVKVAFQYLGSDGAQLLIDDIAVHETEITEPLLPCTPVFEYVEAISNVTFAGINHDSDPDDEINSFEDFSATSGNVTPGESYPISVEGNTWGPYETMVSAYIDWNQNGSFTDPGEYYEIGMIYDSNGFDGVQATSIISVPVDAMSGTTKMRVLKNWDVYAPSSCPSLADEAYGQAEEYSLIVGTLGAPSFDTANFKSYPNPMDDVLNLSYINNMENVTIYNLLGQVVRTYVVNDTTATLNVAMLTAGTYIVKVVSGGTVNTMKVVKK